MEATGDIEWDDDKNRRLQPERGIGFEDVLEAIESGRILADEAHPNPESYGHQRILIVEIDGYAGVVPYVQQGNKRFLQTIYRSRVYQKKYPGSRQP
jgi:uncharacterized DUF497 family protein